MEKEIYTKIDSYVDSTREILYLRPDDMLLIIRPNKIYHINSTGFEILNGLYAEKKSAMDLALFLSEKYRKDLNLITADMSEMINTVNSLMNENYSAASMINTIPFDPESIKHPVLSEIALTYSCQNRCEFCYASSPYRGDRQNEMTTEQIKTIIKKIHEEAKVPTISFTGGEPTLRTDLPELVHYASKLGMRTNLITNGIRCGDSELVAELKKAGLNSSQVSLESHDREIHNRVTGNENAYDSVIQAIHNLKSAGIHTHTNTTICHGNMDHLIPLVDFVKTEFNAAYLSMNMIIATGIARDNDNINIGYSTIGPIIEPVIRRCNYIGVKFVWYSPTPYCIFNPVEHNLGAKSCACVSGLLSVNPSGEIIPCSSYDRGIGSLLHKSFESIWESDQALYYREKRYTPPVCRKCELVPLCSGACPLYWENAGSFKEIEEVRNRKPMVGNFLWNLENKIRVKSKGVRGITAPGSK